jgi:hypothetical protein
MQSLAEQIGRESLESGFRHGAGSINPNTTGLTASSLGRGDWSLS